MKIYIRTIGLLFLLAVALFTKPVFAQNNSPLPKADSLFTNQDWKAAKDIYIKYLGDTSVNSIEWNRLGYCNYQLGLYQDALIDFNRSLANKPMPYLKNLVMGRMAKIYSIMNKPDMAAGWLIKATSGGYNSLSDLDSLPDFKNLRSSSGFKQLRQQVYEILYPCSKDPHTHDFDFWIGDWDVYPTGSKFITGHSHIESMAGGCAILENWTSVQLYTGKSFNYYNPAIGKWEQNWIGSGGPADRNTYNNGEYKNGMMHFTYEGPDANGNKVLGNFIFYNIDKDTVRQYLELSKDGGKTYQVSYDLTYIRKKA